MILTRKISLVFLGVFVCGALSGFLLTITAADLPLSHFLNSTANPQSMAGRINKKYAKRYHLSADEQAKITPLVQEMTSHLYDERHQFAMNVLDTMDAYHQRIANLMTADHRAIYQQDNQQRRIRLSKILDDPEQKQ